MDNKKNSETAHFTDMAEILDFEAVKVSQNDGAYGIMRGRLVRDYLRTAYSGEAAEAEIVSEGVTYKILKRREVTVFYDADGNTLFDVENKRLEKEHGRLMAEKTLKDSSGEPEPVTPMGKTIASIEKQAFDNVCLGGGEADLEPKNSDVVKRQAKEKLEKELAAAKDKSFADPIIGYLLERCREDEGLAEDVVQEHKTWQKCFYYIYSQAKMQTKEICAFVRDDAVYEWAEDYYHKDDKAEEEKKARTEAERKERQKKAAAERAAKVKKNPAKAAPAPKKKEDKPKEQPRPKKNNKDMEGQLDIFSMMGM